ncbi:hypothetical protein [Burkholderia cepacia]|uniref:hypothetical protein n=1 Tax=Burkholderia cepacia TaxID=292 RepID=UPI001591B1C7|nr:hypothetical protein [Burkholderia cepacia]
MIRIGGYDADEMDAAHGSACALEAFPPGQPTGNAKSGVGANRVPESGQVIRPFTATRWLSYGNNSTCTVLLAWPS